MKKERKQYTAEEKVAILRRHLVEKEPISKLCDEPSLQPTVFYRWQKEFFKNGAAAFQTKARTNHQAEQERIEYLLNQPPRILWRQRSAGPNAFAFQPLQHRAVAQRHWIRDAGRNAGRPAERDPRRTRSQVGGGTASAAKAPSTGGMIRSYNGSAR